MIEELIEFLLQEKNATVSFGACYMTIERDDLGPVFTVYKKAYHQKRPSLLYEGHYVQDAIWCLKNAERYK